MKILTLTILICLLFYRIKNTPSSLSKRVWTCKMIKKLENNKKDNNNETMKGAAIILLFLIEVFWIIFYSVLGTKIGTNEAIVMSVLQVFTCLWNIAILMKEVPNAFSYNINDHKFHRFQLLFNLVLDYIYYPYAIYMLLK